MTAMGDLGVEGSSTKEKGLMDMDTSVVIAWGRGQKGTTWQWNKYENTHTYKKNLTLS